MAAKRKKNNSIIKTNATIEKFAFVMIVCIIIISFSVVALISSAVPLN